MNRAISAPPSPLGEENGDLADLENDLQADLGVVQKDEDSYSQSSNDSDPSAGCVDDIDRRDPHLFREISLLDAPSKPSHFVNGQSDVEM